MPFNQHAIIIAIIITSELVFFNKLQAFEKKIIRKLSKKGFKNIIYKKSNHNIFLFVENMSYRDEKKSIESMIEISSIVNQDTLTCIHTRDQVPIFSYHIISPQRHISKVSPISFNLPEVNLNDKKTRYSTQGDMDFTIVPHGRVFFNEEDGIRPQLNLIPGMNTLIWKGGRIKMSAAFQIYNEIKTLEGYDFSWKPAYINFNQLLRLTGNQFVSFTLGQFWEDRYGFDFEWKRFFSSLPLSLGFNWGITSYSFLDYPTWHYTNITEDQRITCFFLAEYIIPRYNLSFQSRTGRFLYGDNGWRIDVKRILGETRIGFFILNSGNEKNVGFTFSIPLFSKRKKNYNKFRLYREERIFGEYRSIRKTYQGQTYQTGHSFENWTPFLTPYYLNRKDSINHNKMEKSP